MTMLLFFILMGLAGILGLAFFHLNTWLMIVVILLSAVGLVLPLTKMKGKPYIGLGLLAAGVLICILSASPETEVQAYQKKLAKIDSLIEQGTTDQAALEVKLLEKASGINDATHLAWSQIYLKMGNLEDALAELERLEDTHSEAAYIQKEAVLRALEENDQLDQMYLEASSLVPDSAYLQLMAGMVRMEQEKPQAAIINFYRAHVLKPENGAAAYYTGVCYYNLGEKDMARVWFSTAEKGQLSDKLKEHLAWYRKELGGGDNA